MDTDNLPFTTVPVWNKFLGERCTAIERLQEINGSLDGFAFEPLSERGKGTVNIGIYSLMWYWKGYKGMRRKGKPLADDFLVAVIVKKPSHGQLISGYSDANGEPSVVRISPTGTILMQIHYRDGEKNDPAHDVPAEREFFADGKIRICNHFRTGKPCDSENGMPAIVRYRHNGTVDSGMMWNAKRNLLESVDGVELSKRIDDVKRKIFAGVCGETSIMAGKSCKSSTVTTMGEIGALTH